MNSAPKGAVAEYHDLAWTVQRAWSMLRLPQLQMVVNETIAELNRIEPSELLGRELSGLDGQSDGQSFQNPVAAALQACSEELRSESGMPGSDAHRATHCELVRQCVTGQPAAWTVTFEEALDKYRRAASRALQASLDAQSASA